MRIGLIGTGRIAYRFLDEIGVVPTASVSVVYNPHYENAMFFAGRRGLDESLVATDDDDLWNKCDAVYIATPHETHSEYIRKALNKGKHVLCEKPMCLSADETLELFELAKEKGLVLMEAVKTAYCPGFKGFLDIVEKGAIGEIHDIEATFTKIGGAAGREIWSEAGGSFTELGTYNLLPVVKLLGPDSNESYIWSYDSVTGADSYTKTIISYDRASATIKTGLGVKSEGQLIVSGEKGYIIIPAPWWITKRIEVHHEDAGRVEVYDYPFEGSGLRYEILDFANKALLMDSMKQKYEQNRDDILPDIWNEIMNASGVSPYDSIWMAAQMEIFLTNREKEADRGKAPESNLNTNPDKNVSNKKDKIRYWGHRGCSMKYPENTLEAFEAAAKLDGICGIELDVQLTKDGEMVVIHDETLDRTTTGKGKVVDKSLEDIRELWITPSGSPEAYCTKDGNKLVIPTLSEVFDLLKPYCLSNGFMINIELKNSIVRYEGLEEKVLKLVKEYELENNIVYSSFNHESMGLIKQFNPSAKTGLLGSDILLCLEDMDKYHADAVHPSNIGMGINPETVSFFVENNIPVRMWNGEEPLYGQSRILKTTDLYKYELLGATDIITNVPELYVI